MSSTNEKEVWKCENPVGWKYEPPFGEGEGGPKCHPIRFGTGWDDYKFAGWICYCTNEHTFIDGRDRPKM